MRLIGAPLLITATFAQLFGIPPHNVGTVAGLTALPMAAWEFSRGVYLVGRDFKLSPITAGVVEPSTPPAHSVAAL